MASSNLHARRRGSHFSNDPEDPVDPTEMDSSGRHGLLPDPGTAAGSTASEPSPATPKKRPKRRRGARMFFRLLPDDLRWALGAVSSFLFFGLVLGYFMLHHQHRKVILHVMKDPWAHGGAVLRGRAGFRHHFYSGEPRFVTIVMPSVVNPGGRGRRLKAIQDTWGPSARAIYVVHNVTEFPAASHAVIAEGGEPEDKFAFPQLMLLPPDIGVEDGLPRLYYTIKTIHERVNPEFAFFVNDHTFVIPEHLCKFLEFYEPTEDMYAGHALKDSQMQIFNSGAAGYVLSRATMEKMMRKHNDALEGGECSLSSSAADKWLQGNPGMATLKCINSVGVRATDTRAAGHWHRFHAFPLTRVVSGKVDEWYKNKHKDMGSVEGFDPSYEELLSGEECCARTSVSFHYVEASEARALFSVRNLLLSNPALTDHELRALMYAEWPRESKDLGPYSHGLPKPADADGWSRLLAVIRKLSTRETQRDC